MRSLKEAVGREAIWRPRSLLSRTFDLVDPEAADAEPYLTLTWRPGFLMRGPAEAESADGRWVFRHRGFFREQVLVSAAGSDAPLATLQRYWLRGVLRFEGGREFVWRRESFWSTAHRFEDANGTLAVRFRHRFSFPRASMRVEFESSAATAGDQALLACLGWYLLLLGRRRAAWYGAG